MGYHCLPLQGPGAGGSQAHNPTLYPYSFIYINILTNRDALLQYASKPLCVSPQNLGPESRKYRMLLQSFLLFIYLLLLLVVLPSFFCYCCCFCGPGLVPTLVDELESATRSDCSTIEDTGLSLLHTLPTTTSELPREEEKKKRRYELATSWRGSKIVCC